MTLQGDPVLKDHKTLVEVPKKNEEKFIFAKIRGWLYLLFTFALLSGWNVLV